MLAFAQCFQAAGFDRMRSKKAPHVLRLVALRPFMKNNYSQGHDAYAPRCSCMATVLGLLPSSKGKTTYCDGLLSGFTNLFGANLEAPSAALTVSCEIQDSALLLSVEPCRWPSVFVFLVIISGSCHQKDMYNSSNDLSRSCGPPEVARGRVGIEACSYDAAMAHIRQMTILEVGILRMLRSHGGVGTGEQHQNACRPTTKVLQGCVRRYRAASGRLAVGRLRTADDGERASSGLFGAFSARARSRQRPRPTTRAGCIVQITASPFFGLALAGLMPTETNQKPRNALFPYKSVTPSEVLCFCTIADMISSALLHLLYPVIYSSVDSITMLQAIDCEIMLELDKA